MASPPSNGREGDGKEHRSYNDPIQDMSSGREVPVAAIGAGLRSERFDLQRPDDRVAPPASIAQPMSSNSTEVEESEYLEERYSQSPHPQAVNKMKVLTCLLRGVVCMVVIPYTYNLT